MNSKRGLLAIATAGALLVAAPVAVAHIERASYWPAPAAEVVDGVPAGGKVPELRGLFTALDPKPAGSTRVVCQGAVPKAPKSLKGKKKGKLTDAERADRRVYSNRLHANKSIKRLKKSIKKATTAKKKANRGYVMRPSEPRVKVGKKAADKLLKFNVKLLKRCKYDSIQEAVNNSGNNDRVVVLPGLYTEPESRAAPTNDPKCDAYEIANDKGSVNALSYAYQYTCPNDQNLIAVLGRSLGSGTDPQPPLDDRHVIPNAGSCIRCNLQMEGSGVKPEDVTVDAGNTASGNSGPIDPVKDVVVRADRADGFALHNMNLRHAKEHGIYILETDGYRLSHFKAFYNAQYGVLTFVSDHGLMADCEAAGSGDSGLYPGASPESGEQTIEGSQRYNTEIRDCDMHHNAAGYSGTDANGVWVHHNDLYDNANGFTTDVFTASGHPGFPQDSDLIENNEFYSNNFNPYKPGTDVVPTVPMPVGTGMWIAGGNNNVIRNNHFWDNWRRGTMQFAVPDAFVCEDLATNPNADPVTNCNSDPGTPVPGTSSTSYRNRYYGNVMGRTPEGKRDPNGEDFWWDQQGIVNNPDNTQNCWFSNTGKDGTAASVTSTPPGANLPSDCGDSFVPDGDEFGQTGELFGCLANLDYNGGCVWFTTPPEPQ